MKYTVRYILLLVCMFNILFLLSCSKGISSDEAKATASEFFDAVSSENYDKAESLLHPDRFADIEKFILSVENEKNIDFSKGVTIQKYTGFSSSLHDSSVDGARYELSMKTAVGDTEADFTMEIVKNNGGYGIYNLVLDK